MAKKDTKKKANKKSQELVPIKKKASSLPAVKKTKALSIQDPLQQYMSEVSRYPILTPEEEVEVAKHYEEHEDKESAQKLVLSNLRLVVKIAIEYRSAYYNSLDLIQEGNLGLMRAVQKFDVERGVRFSSYAVWWIRAYILKHILDNFRLVKVGTTQAQKKLFFNLMKEKEKIEKMGIQATPKLISERLDVKEKEVVEMQKRLGSRELELDAPRAHFEGALNMDFLQDEEPMADDHAEQKQLQGIMIKNLDEFVHGLNEKETEVFQTRLYSEIPKTLQEIADQYGITRERIRQIESKVIKKMRGFFKEKGLDVQLDPGAK
jgi:RNA polymerase sigma-32 factor